MGQTILLSFNETEFKTFLREVLAEILHGEKSKDDIGHAMTIQEAARFLNLKVSTVYEKTSERSIPHMKKGNRLYFHRHELEAWLKEGKVKTAQELKSEVETMSLQRKTYSASRHRVKRVSSWPSFSSAELAGKTYQGDTEIYPGYPIKRQSEDMVIE